MSRGQCYYEILGVSETAGSDDIKRAYRNLALVWHPDKNQANAEEAHVKFQAILKAYETLSDSREREWYDRHKDQILCDGNQTGSDNCVSLFQYFSASCYSIFDDSEDGFYTVYRKLFQTIADEETQAQTLLGKLSKNKHKKEEKQEYPSFGDSKSEYESVVRPFYAYWSGFCTALTFDNLDKYNTTEAENRRILRAMEKENRKVKEQARKERNTNVRNLVEFIKKRDKRLKAHKLLVDQQNELNRKKTAEKQRQQREKKKSTLDYKPTAWENLDDIEEQLKQLESEYDSENLGKRSRNRVKDLPSDEEPPSNHDDEVPKSETPVQDDPRETTEEKRMDAPKEIDNALESGSEDEEITDYFCPACNKDFRSIKAFENHEASKKHKQNVVKLTKLLTQEEKAALNKPGT